MTPGSAGIQSGRRRRRRRGRGRALGRIAEWGDTLRESFFFLPGILSIVAALLAFVLIDVDRELPPGWADGALFVRPAGADGTRALLSAIVGSMITVTGVVFSITIVALTLTSQQFGPRLLRNFVRDRGNQLVLGIFVATFLYSLIVLRAVHQDAVPHLSSAIAVVLAIASMFVLIWFVHHTATSIQASQIVATVAREVDEQLSKFDELDGVHADQDGDDPSTWPPVAAVVRSTESGYVRLVAIEDLVSVAANYDIVIELVCQPGEFVVRGAELARVRANDARAPKETLEDEVRDGVVLGAQRTALQDLAFLIGQLVEIAVRALSPGINDPMTAVGCLERLGSIVGSLAEKAFEDTTHHDEDDHLRVIAPCPTYDDLVGLAFDSIRHYGAADKRVVLALLRAHEVALGRCREAERRRTLEAHVSQTEDAWQANGPHATREDAEVQLAATAALHARGSETRNMKVES
ncbi:MAG: DUF2254 domain-containing protein [Planctomycetes bacterium]|nr:DUF2254 domain-containing protein [Planctomycetota bacterium]